MRITPASKPVFENEENTATWPCQWIAPHDRSGANYVIAYRLRLELPVAACVRVHVSADQRYRLFVDGNLEGEGPERGDILNWYYQTYELDLTAGSHCLVALVWSLEGKGIVPSAQVSLNHGFVLTADAPYTCQFSTGLAAWEYRSVEGVNFRMSGLSGAGLCSGATMWTDGTRFPWGVERGAGEGWRVADSSGEARTRLGGDNWGILNTSLLSPGTLPSTMGAVHLCTNLRYTGTLLPDRSLPSVCPEQSLPEAENNIVAAWKENQPVRIEKRQRLWMLLDLDDYYCGFPEVTVEEGADAEIHVLWAEALLEDPGNPCVKGHRDEIMGKTFVGRGDTFYVGRRAEPSCFTSFWWSCGRYLAVVIETKEEPLLLHPVRIRETRYPLEMNARLYLQNDDFERSKQLMWRAVQMCAHETYMDCPYYEQLNYVGDTRIQSLVTYVMDGDDRLAKQCISLFASSLLPTGMMSACYPAENPQIIPQFSLYWVAMLHDFALWRNNPQWVRRFLPHSRFILDTFLGHVDADGLFHCPDGWNWVDWAWRSLSAESLPRLVVSVNQLQLIYVLGLAADLERWIGRADIARHYELERSRLWERTLALFWDKKKGLFGSDVTRTVFTEHAQCFAVLCGMLDEEQKQALRCSLTGDPELERATYYFQHYLFETYAALGLETEIVHRFASWGVMADLGLKTTLERKEQDRSDCHAWSSHPLYHAAASIGGIRPDSPGFASVRIKPALHALSSASISLPHPKGGDVAVAWTRQADQIEVTTTLPAGLKGTLELPDGKIIELQPGAQTWKAEDVIHEDINLYVVQHG